MNGLLVVEVLLTGGGGENVLFLEMWYRFECVGSCRPAESGRFLPEGVPKLKRGMRLGARICETDVVEGVALSFSDKGTVSFGADDERFIKSGTPDRFKAACRAASLGEILGSSDADAGFSVSIFEPLNDASAAVDNGSVLVGVGAGGACPAWPTGQGCHVPLGPGNPSNGGTGWGASLAGSLLSF